MAAPSRFEGSAMGTDAAGAWSFTANTGGGRVIIMQILQDGSTDGAITSVVGTNVTDLAGTADVYTQIVGPNGDGSFPVGGSGQARQFLFIGRTTAAASHTISGANSTSEDLYAFFHVFDNVSTGTTLAAVIENGTAGATANTAGTDGTVTDAGVTTLGPDRLALQFVAINDDNVQDPFTGETGGTWSEAVAEYAESSGTDASIGLQIGWVGAVGHSPGSLISHVLYGGSGTNEQLAQSFASPGAVTVTGIYLATDTTGSPSDDIVVEIQTDSAGSPSGTVVGDSASLSASEISRFGTTNTPTKFPVTAGLAASTTYWIVTRRTGARDTSNYFQLFRSNGAGTYTGGVFATKDSGAWSSTGYDCLFIVEASTGGTIDGGTFTNADAADGWGVIGFALIGTTVAATSLPPFRPLRHPLIYR